MSMLANLFAASAGLGPRRRLASRVTLVMGIFAVAWPAEVKAWTGQPLACVTSANGISVIDTGNNSVVGTIACCSVAAVAPDGKYVYALVPGFSSFRLDISVIDASNDVVIGTIPLNISSVPGARGLRMNLSG
jgi:DNA-binding beta-propeller fold protein YncE